MKKILTALVLMSCLNSFSQVDPSYSPLINQKTLQHIIGLEFFNNFNTRLSDLGLSGVCYTMFQIDSLGRPVNIRVSPGTNSTLSKFLQECLAKTNGYWRSSKEKMDLDETLILPLVYNLQKDGRTTLVTTPPHSLLAFLSPENDRKPMKVVFLETIEYTSPFENCFTDPQIELKKQNLNKPELIYFRYQQIKNRKAFRI